MADKRAPLIKQEPAKGEGQRGLTRTSSGGHAARHSLNLQDANMTDADVSCCIGVGTPLLGSRDRSLQVLAIGDESDVVTRCHYLPVELMAQVMVSWKPVNDRN